MSFALPDPGVPPDAVLERDAVIDRLRTVEVPDPEEGVTGISDATDRSMTELKETLRTWTPPAPVKTLNDFPLEQVVEFVMTKISADDFFFKILSKNRVPGTATLQTPDIDIDLTVWQFNESEDQISFVIDRGRNVPRLRLGVAYKITHGGRSYEVTFVGGFHPSAEFRFAVMCFLRAKEPTTP